MLHCLKLIDPSKDDKIYAKPTSPEIRDLMALGHFNFSRLVSTYPNSNYIVIRHSALDVAVAELERHTTLVLHSYVGNGKTIFKNALALRLAKEKRSCFEYRHGREVIECDIDYLRQLKSPNTPVIFFSSYDDFRAVIRQFSDMPADVRYVLEMDTGTFYVRQKELADIAPGKLGKVPLNKLRDEDISNLEDLLDKAGILQRDDFAVLKSKGAEFREYVLSLFKNAAVRKLIQNVAMSLLNNREFRKFLYASLIARVLDVEVSLVFLRRVTGVDPFDTLANNDLGHARDLFEVAETYIYPRSAVLAEFLLNDILDPDDIAHWLLELGFHAANVKAQEIERGNIGSSRFMEANHLLGAFFKFTDLANIFGKNRSGNDRIAEIYEKGRRNELINKEPLFWLQYSIFQASIDRLELAEQYIDTAYDRASAIAGFRTYQIDTYALSLYLRIEETMSATSAVSRLESICEKLGQVREMINDGSHRNFALVSLAKMGDFIKARLGGLQKHEKVRLVYELNLIINRLNALPIDIKVQFATDKIRDQIVLATQLLLA
jgi:hypothetical protein